MDKNLLFILILNALLLLATAKGKLGIDLSQASTKRGIVATIAGAVSIYQILQDKDPAPALAVASTILGILGLCIKD